MIKKIKGKYKTLSPKYIQAALQQIFSCLQGATRRLVAKATAPRSNTAGRENICNPSGYGQFRLTPCLRGLDVSQRIHLRPCSLRQTKLVSIATEDTLEMGSVLSETTRRKFGSYDTEEEAKKRLRQVEFFKHLKAGRKKPRAGNWQLATGN